MAIENDKSRSQAQPKHDDPDAADDELVRFRCFRCDSEVVVNSDEAGKQARCSRCNTANLVPAPDDPLYENRCQDVRRGKLAAIEKLRAEGKITEEQLLAAMRRIGEMPWGLPVHDDDPEGQRYYPGQQG